MKKRISGGVVLEMSYPSSKNFLIFLLDLIFSSLGFQEILFGLRIDLTSLRIF